MIEKGVFVRCPIDREHPQEPRIFATGKVVSVNEFNETAHISFSDPDIESILNISRMR